MILPRSMTQWVTRQRQIRSGSELQKSAGKPKVNLRRRSQLLHPVRPDVLHRLGKALAATTRRRADSGIPTPLPNNCAPSQLVAFLRCGPRDLLFSELGLRYVPDRFSCADHLWSESPFGSVVASPSIITRLAPLSLNPGPSSPPKMKSKLSLYGSAFDFR